MTDEEIIKKAGSVWQRTRGTMDSYLKLVVKFAREDEREICAKIVDRKMDGWILGKEVSDAIRGGEK